MQENEAKKADVDVNHPSDTADGANAGSVMQGDGEGQAPTPKNDSENDVEFKDTSDHDDDPVKAKPATDRNRERDAENARRRREAERQKELRETREKTIIDTLNGKNPYTGEEMKDSADVEEYQTMREIEKNGGDPITDYPRYRKDKQREYVKQQEETEKKQEWYRNDRESFMQLHPDVDLDELVADEDFREYAEGKVGVKPLSEIYSGFMRFVEKYNEKAKVRAAQYLANKNASPGALHNTDSAESDFFTADQVRAMSQEEVRKNFEKIQSSMKKWK